MATGNKLDWLSILLRHFTTVIVIVGAIWWLATPRVEAFIMQTVNDRITRVEILLQEHSNRLAEILKMLHEDRK